MVPYIREIEEIDLAPNEKRFSCYRHFIAQCYGQGALGKQNRVKVPFCIEEEINDWFPNLDGEPRTGFMEAPGHDNNDNF
jgi:hypothetical protein